MLSRRIPVASVRLGQTLRCQPSLPLNSSRLAVSVDINETAVTGLQQRWASTRSPAIAISGTFCHGTSIVDERRFFCIPFPVTSANHVLCLEVVHLCPSLQGRSGPNEAGARCSREVIEGTETNAQFSVRKHARLDIFSCKPFTQLFYASA
jgi:hypothetical protein